MDEVIQLLSELPMWVAILGLMGTLTTAILGALGGGAIALIKSKGDIDKAKVEAEATLKTTMAQAEVERERTLLDGLAERVKHLEERVQRLEMENRELEMENAMLRSTKLTLEEALQSSIEMIKAWEAFEASGFASPPGRPSPGWPIRPYLGPQTDAIQKVAEASEKLHEVLDE